MTLAKYLCGIVLMLHIIYTECEYTCSYDGELDTNETWYGYIGYVHTESEQGRLEFNISYSADQCCANLILYTDNDTYLLTDEMTCEEKVGILPPENNQQVFLTPADHWSGCQTVDNAATLSCIGSRIFRSSRKRVWPIAVSNCEKGIGQINYHLTVTQSEPCMELEESNSAVEPPANTSPTKDSHISLTTIIYSSGHIASP